jgi:hypothetical protein
VARYEPGREALVQDLSRFRVSALQPEMGELLGDQVAELVVVVVELVRDEIDARAVSPAVPALRRAVDDCDGHVEVAPERGQGLLGQRPEPRSVGGLDRAGDTNGHRGDHPAISRAHVAVSQMSQIVTTKMAARKRITKATRMRGRPDGLTTDVHKRIVEAVRLGAHFEEAGAAAGISRSTLHRWLARGDATNAPQRFRTFLEAVPGRGRARAGGTSLDRPGRGGRRLAAQAWKLERRYPARWGPQTRHELTGPEGEPLAVRQEDSWDTAKLSDRELAVLQELVEKMGREL